MGFNFYSPSLYVQITGEGKAFRLSEKKSQKYWDSRPRKSQLSQWVSQQSQPIKNRSELLQKLDEAEARFENKTIPKPNHWGGYEVSIYSLEFWMGKENRLHERVQFLSDETFRKWEISLLSP